MKGTTGAGDAVELTIGEVRHARSHRGHVALFILHGIDLRDGSPGPIAHGGESIVTDPWDVDGGTLEPTRFIWSPRT